MNPNTPVLGLCTANAFLWYYLINNEPIAIAAKPQKQSTLGWLRITERTFYGKVGGVARFAASTAMVSAQWRAVEVGDRRWGWWLLRRDNDDDDWVVAR
ncbi:hypothetical protein Tco_0073953 [Tanacetum coccineum]